MKTLQASAAHKGRLAPCGPHGHLHSCPRRSDAGEPPPPLRSRSALLHCLRVSWVTAESPQASGAKSSVVPHSALEAQPILAASFTCLGDFQGTSSVFIWRSSTCSAKLAVK